MMTARQHIRNILILLVIAIIGLVWYLSTDDVAEVPMDKMVGTAPAPEVSKIRPEGFPTIKIPDVVGWPAGKTPVAADGMQVTAFAQKLAHPRWLYQLPNGDVLVAESNSPDRDITSVGERIARYLIEKSNGGGASADRITLLRDKDGNGSVDETHVLLDKSNGLKSPIGMALVGDRLFIGNSDAVLAFPYKPGDTKIAGKGEKIVDLPHNLPNNHWTRNVIALPDGKTLLVTVGSNSNIAEGGMDAEKNRANILEVDIASKKSRIYAYGLRNPTGLAMEPINKVVWTTVNERDMLGSDGPSDYMATVDFGSFYGWPWYYWGKNKDRRVEQNRLDLFQYTKRPNYALGPHVAALGISFAQTPALGENFARGAFVGLHGSWNRSPVSGYKVVFVPFNDRGFPEGKPVDVLTGFLDKGEDKVFGRPAGVLVLKDGSLLVADDSGNAVWRVSAKAAAQ